MSSLRVLTIRILGPLLGTSMLFAADFSIYRGIQFGASLPVAAKQGGMKVSGARPIQQRPALIQELDWQPRGTALGDAKADPVRDGMLSFYNGELFRIVVTYDRFLVEGMTPEDMIHAISTTYGTASKPTVEIPFHSVYGESTEVLARWEDPGYSYNLTRTADHSSFAMVLFSKRLDALAQASIVEAARLDALDAPQKEIDLQKKKQAEDQLALDKARLVNMPNFRP